jgi:hypothetical protein
MLVLSAAPCYPILPGAALFVASCYRSGCRERFVGLESHLCMHKNGDSLPPESRPRRRVLPLSGRAGADFHSLREARTAPNGNSANFAVAISGARSGGGATTAEILMPMGNIQAAGRHRRGEES